MLIEFGTWKYKLFILLFYPLGFYLLRNFFAPSTTLYNFSVYFSFLLSGIIYLIILFKSRSKNNTEISVFAEKGSAINQIDEQQKEEQKKKIKKEKKSIFLLALVYCLPDWINLFFGDKINNMNNTGSVEIFKLSTFYFCILFSKLILREKIYKHRVISIIIISICYLIIIIISGFFVFNIKFSLGLLLLLIFTFSKLSIGALFFVLSKKHFNTYSTDPYLFIFYLGLFSFVSYIPFEIIYYFFLGGNNEIIGEGVISQIISNPKEFLKNFFYSLVLTPLYLFTYGSQTLVIYHFTPCIL